MADRFVYYSISHGREIIKDATFQGKNLISMRHQPGDHRVNGNPGWGVEIL